jgi:hypothetical protein
VSNIKAVPGELRVHDIVNELAREYDFGGRVYRIDEPQKLYMRAGGTTHRVLDKTGTVHVVPAPGEYACVMRWFPRDINNPVAF